MTTQAQVSLIPLFTRETAAQKVRKAEDGWNSRNPEKVSLAYTVDSVWRNCAEFVTGREQIVQFFDPQMEARAGVSSHQGALGV